MSAGSTLAKDRKEAGAGRQAQGLPPKLTQAWVVVWPSHSPLCHGG